MPVDREQAYEFLCRMAEGISGTFGASCETVIHELDGQRIVNLVFFNGHVTGRTAGSTLSIYGRDTADGQGSHMNMELDYLNDMVLVNGKRIKSTTIHMRGADYHFALGINFDVTALEEARQLLGGLSAGEGELIEHMRGEGQAEIEELFEACQRTQKRDVASMKKPERVQLVRLLKEQGAFNFHRSVPYVAQRMGVSKYTIYNYLKELEQA